MSITKNLGKLIAPLAISTLLVSGACAGGGGEPTAASVCARLGELAGKASGDAKEMWDKNLGPDCVKEMGEEMTKLGPEKFKAAAACIDKAASLEDAMKTCEPK